MPTISIPVEVEEKWQDVVDVLAEVASVPIALIVRYEPPNVKVIRTNRINVNPFVNGAVRDVTGLYCETVIRKNVRLHVRNAAGSTKWRFARSELPNIVSYLGYPLVWPDSAVFGTICVLDTKENPFSETVELLLGQFRELVESHLAGIYASNDECAAEQRAEQPNAHPIPAGTMISMCAKCKKIRDDDGHWQAVEAYFGERSNLRFTHGICPTCMEELYPGRSGGARRRDAGTGPKE